MKREIENYLIVRRVVASMAIEDMYFPKEFLEEMLKVANGEISSEEVRKRIIAKYVR